MRRKFGEMLDAYSEHAKRENGEQDADVLDAADAEFNALIARGVGRRKSTPETQRAIYAIQQEKQRVMERLRADVAALGTDAERVEPDADAHVVVQDADGLCWSDASGRVWPVTVGALMTDGMWGVRYALDSKTVPRNIRKRYVIATAKQEIRRLLNEQITLDEVASRSTPEPRRQTYDVIRSDQRAERRIPGLLAERMVLGFLMKLAIDYRVDFDVRPVDVFEDVEQKIDFIVRRTGGDGAPRAIGIQFTIDQNAVHLAEKREKIARVRAMYAETLHVDDIVLVRIPMRDVLETLEQWENLGCPPGGPDALWREEQRADVFRKTLAPLFASAELDVQWSRIREMPDADARDMEEAA